MIKEKNHSGAKVTKGQPVWCYRYTGTKKIWIVHQFVPVLILDKYMTSGVMPALLKTYKKSIIMYRGLQMCNQCSKL
jgi:hypothetical protein